MSAFIVADETINSIVSWLEIEIFRGNGWLRGKLEAYYREVDKPIPLFSVNRWQKDFAMSMFELNVAAVEARYGKGKENRKLNFKYKRVVPPEDIQVLKSINCWLWQCMEGDVPEHPLYRLFDDVVVRHLLETIVYKLPEYDKATWG